MKRVLFLTPGMPEKSGATNFTKAVVRAVGAQDGVVLSKYVVPAPEHDKAKLTSVLQGFAQGANYGTVEEICEIILAEKISCLVANFTFWGKLLACVRRRFPTIKIITVAHDRETDLILDCIKIAGVSGIRRLPTLLAVMRNERLQISLTDKLVCLNQRDSDRFFACYSRRADMMIPIFLEDHAEDVCLDIPHDSGQKPYGLFVGSKKLPPNEEGVRWFVSSVARESRCHFKIVGEGFEELRDEFRSIPNVEFVGTVDSLDEYYVNAQFVFSPIFSGAGMKTKTAEALMYGKYILGSDEALEGFDTIERAGCASRCNRADEYINVIERLKSSNMRYYPCSRALFKQQYSLTSATEKFGQLLSIL